MTSRILLVACSLALNAAPALACELGGLTDAIDRLKGGNEPTAGNVARACVTIIKNQDQAAVTKELAGMVMMLNANFDGDPKHKDAINNCAPDMYRRAC